MPNKEMDIKALARIIHVYYVRRTALGTVEEIPCAECIKLSQHLSELGYRLPVKHTVISEIDMLQWARDNGHTFEDIIDPTKTFKIYTQAQVDKDNKEH
jgi:hypothetical protein